MLYVGIDPGVNGGLCLLNATGHIIECVRTPRTKDGIDVNAMTDLIRDWMKKDLLTIYVENVHAIFGAGAKNTFNFGANLGIIFGVLGALGLQFHLVTPREWQKLLHVDENGEKLIDKDPKKRSLLASRRIFRDFGFLATDRSSVPHDGMIDAALIAEYGRQKSCP